MRAALFSSLHAIKAMRGAACQKVDYAMGKPPVEPGIT